MAAPASVLHAAITSKLARPTAGPKFGSPEWRAMYPRHAAAQAASAGPAIPPPAALATPPPAPADPAMPGDTIDPAGQGQANDVQVITQAAANDPVIAAIARVLGIQL